MNFAIFGPLNHVFTSKVIKRSFGMVEYVFGHYRSPKVVMLKIGLYHRCLGSNQGVLWNNEVNDGASLREFQGGRVHNGALQWKSQGG